MARYSILGVRPRLVLLSKDRVLRRITAKKESRVEIPEGKDPLDILKEEMAVAEPVPVEGLPKFCGGAVGLLSYDLVRFFEKLASEAKDDLLVDDMCMMLCDTVVVFDHA